MLKIYVNPDEIWDYFQKHKVRLAEQLDVIAEIESESESGLQIFVTEDNGFPLLSIEYEDEVLEKECAISQSDCTVVARKFFKMVEDHKDEYMSEVSQYSDSSIVTDLSEDSETNADWEYVEEREDELKLLLTNFLLAAMGMSEGDMEFDDGELSALLDEIEDSVYNTVNCVLYRPRMIEDEETGQLSLVESIYDA